jgi:hypothetical protein
MKSYIILILVMAMLAGGCEQTAGTAAIGDVNSCQRWLADFGPQSAEILGLSRFDSESGKKTLKVYVGLIDRNDSYIKAPAIFRVEVYEHTVRSPVHRGKRIGIMGDTDLRGVAVNNNYWRDYLHAYQFDLDAASARAGQTYYIEVTVVLPDGKRTVAQRDIAF